jgi:hypothetical protein
MTFKEWWKSQFAKDEPEGKHPRVVIVGHGLFGYKATAILPDKRIIGRDYSRTVAGAVHATKVFSQLASAEAWGRNKIKEMNLIVEHEKFKEVLK